MSYNKNLYTSASSALDAGIIYDTTIGKMQDEINADVNTFTSGRSNALSTRWHVDCVNGDDNDTGDSGHAWRTLDKFFSMANKLKGGRADIRCYLDTPGIYTVGSSSELIRSFTGLAFHITGGFTTNPVYDGNYIIRFLNTSEIKFYVCHANFKNIRFEFPNITSDVKFAFDGGNFSIGQCYIDGPLDIYGAPGTIADTTIQNVTINNSNVLLSRVKTLSTTTNQYILYNNANVFYSGSISEGSLLAQSTYPAFNVSASILNVAQVYPNTLGTSIQSANAVIICSEARVNSWKSKAGTVTNTTWVTDSGPQKYVAGDVYEVSNAIVPVVLTGSAKSFHFGFSMPKAATATTVTLNELIGAIRVSDGGYVSDGTTASSLSNWMTGSNIDYETPGSISASVSNNYLFIAIKCLNVPTVNGNALPNNSMLVYEGSVKVAFS